MAERVQIVVNASTEQAQAALAAVGDASVGMASSARTAAQSTIDPFNSLKLTVVALESAVNLTRDAFELLIEPLRRSVEIALELRDANDPARESISQLADSFERLQGSVGAVIIEIAETTGVVDILTGRFDRLTAQILDADSEIGSLVRTGLAQFVGAAGFVVDATIAMAQGFSTLLDAGRVAQEWLTGFFLEAEQELHSLRQAIIGNQVIAADAELDRLTQESERLRQEWDATEARVYAASEGMGVGATNILLAQSEALYQAYQDTNSQIAEQRQELEELGREYERSGARIMGLEDAIRGQEDDLTQATAALDRNVQGWQALRAEIGGIFDDFQSFVAGIGDAGFGNAPGEDGGGGEGGNTPFLALARFFGVRGAVGGVGGGGQLHRGGLGGLSAAATRGAAGSLGELGEEFDAFAAGVQSAMQSAGQAFVGGLGTMFEELGAFLAGAEGGFRNWGEAVKGLVSSTFSSIGSAFQQAAAQALVSGGFGGPFGAFLGIGALFSIAAGLISGSGGRRSDGGIRTVEVLQTIRPEVAGPGTTQITQLQIGAVFSRDSGRRTFAELMDEADQYGERG